MKRQDKDIAWLDFARGVADAELDHEIRQRMASGSETDIKEVGLWRQVAALGRSDVERQVPGHEDTTRIVKAMGSMFLPRKAEAGIPRLRRLVADLTFGSQLAPAGVRSGSQESSHSVFSLEDYVFDVRLESHGPESYRLDGQVILVEQESRSLEPKIPVLVFHNDELITSIVCDESGEFHSAELAQPPSQLQLLLEQNLHVEIPLG